MAIDKETELYEPIKLFLQAQGYTVRAEVLHCDLVAIRGTEDPVIVELKKSLNLPLLVQGIERFRHSPKVYIAFEINAKKRAPHGLKWTEIERLCRMLGLGVLTVKFYKRMKPRVAVLCDPTPYVPKQIKRRTLQLLGEFNERSGDYNVGGSSRRKLITAYREKALHCAFVLKQHGPSSPRQLKEIVGSEKVSMILQKNYYRWFERVKRGIYILTPAGEQALQDYHHVLK